MLNMIKISAVLVIVVAIATVTEGNVRDVDDFSFQSILKLFRAELLSEIAQKWNITIKQSEVLRTHMGVCNGKIQATVDQCRNCTSKLCKDQPVFTDYTDQLDPVSALQKPLTEVSDNLAKVVKLLGTESFTFLDAVENIGVEAGVQLGGELNSVATSIGNELLKLPDVFASGSQDLLNGLKDIGNGAASSLSDLGISIGGGLTDAGNAIANGLSDLFGRRRRYYGPVEEECMNRCDAECFKLMTNNNTVMLDNVCGHFVITLNATIQRSIDKLVSLYNATLDTAAPIITKIEIDESSMNPATMSFTTMYVTGDLRGQVTRYRSAVPYMILNLPDTAKQVAREFWTLWN